MTALIKALVAARKQIGGAVKDKVNPAFRSKYADLSAVIDAVKEPLEKHGLTFVQDIEDGKVVTVILHESGEVMKLAAFPIIATKPDAQGHGSALTYARRYSLQTALGVPAEDDDGNAASKTKDVKVAPAKAAMAGESYTHEQIVAITAIASALTDFVAAEAEGEDQSYKIWELVEPLTNEEKLLLWNLLADQSRVRARVKAVSQAHMKKAA